MNENEIFTIRKVKWSDRTRRVHIEYENAEDETNSVFTLDSDDKPAPELIDSFKALTPVVMDVMELRDDEFNSRIFPFGVTFRYDSNGTMSASITAYLKVNYSMSLVPFNTPFTRSERGDNRNTVCFTSTALQLLEKVEQEALAYINGKRNQIDLFNQGDSDASHDSNEATEDGGSDEEEMTTAKVIDFPVAAQT